MIPRLSRLGWALRCGALAGMLSMATLATAQDPLLTPGDPILAIDFDLAPTSSSPDAEQSDNAVDGDPSTKYLNFGEENSGLIATPGLAQFGPSQSFRLTTANDAIERDPTSWELWGTNDAICSELHSQGLCENWTLIGSGSVDLPEDRMVFGPVVPFTNTMIYNSYKMIFPTVRDAAAANSMQIADLQLFDDNGLDVLFAGDATLAIDTDLAETSESNYPAAESPPLAIDADVLTKYLNFGEENSGFIVTPDNPSIIESFQITTANDAEERDPATWELYGTNDPIASTDNSLGDGEDWTLIDSGTVDLPADRDTEGPIVPVINSGAGGGSGGTAYSSYRMIFPTVKDEAAANSMQLAEIQFFGEFSVTFNEADFDRDGDVDGDDFLLWQTGFGTPSDAEKMDGDYNNDGKVDGDDFLGWQSNFGFQSGEGASAVPEPSTALALAICLAGLSLARRRRR